jgi:hypothetical protein
MRKKLQKLLFKIFSSRGLFLFVFVSLAAASCYLAFRMVTDPSTREYYTLSLVQCLLGIFLLFLPSIAARSFKATLSSWMMVAYVLFIYAGVYLGEMHDFYFRVPHWDTLLHFISGALLGILGYALISFLNNSKKIPLALSPLFAAIFIFCFSMTLAVFWEIYEFTVDSLLGINTQKWALADGTPLVGQAALVDTMKDLIVAALGAGIFSVISYFAIKKNAKWLDQLNLKRLP